MGIKITGTGTINGHRSPGLCPQCQKSNILPNKSGLYSVPRMFKTETGRCTECGYVEFEIAKGKPTDQAHGGCRSGCRIPHRVSLPVIRDRADGVKGHFCIGRYIDGFYMQYWSVKHRQYLSTADYDPLTEEAAIKLRDEIIATIRENEKDATQA